MGIVLGPNRYGKAEVRLVHLDRSTPRHVLTDLTVTSQLTGDFTATYTTGANDAVIATDTQKNAVYALARTGGVGTVESFALRLARYFVDRHEQVRGARQGIRRHTWDRVVTGSGAEHDHTFVRAGTETRTVVVVKDGDDETVVPGLTDFVLCKSTDSEFWGFPQVEYTSLPETTDRILATAVSARWRCPGSAAEHDRRDWDGMFASVRAAMLDRFAETYSYSLQQTLHAMGVGVLEGHPDIAEVRFSMPNKHHVLVDLSPWGMDNPNEVWCPSDRPYGLIEAAVIRDDGPGDEAVWAAVAGFC